MDMAIVHSHNFLQYLSRRDAAVLAFVHKGKFPDLTVGGSYT